MDKNFDKQFGNRGHVDPFEEIEAQILGHIGGGKNIGMQNMGRNIGMRDPFE